MDKTTHNPMHFADHVLAISERLRMFCIKRVKVGVDQRDFIYESCLAGETHALELREGKEFVVSNQLPFYRLLASVPPKVWRGEHLLPTGKPRNPVSATETASEELRHSVQDRTGVSLPERSYDRWTSDEEEELLSLWYAATPIPGIAIALQRREGAVRSRLQKMGYVLGEDKPIGNAHAQADLSNGIAWATGTVGGDESGFPPARE